ncbi:microtubule-associated tumor suppressor 1 homolog A-like [Limulus polyphemus]|uniref:Microtubule-associated tumor suppressor 1 homolog A-like n=1 Tax=Limulus polyphemus TaxID=6850 RepID=A0ABM1S8Q7_LIMPO|nr:microtubule-associated tumor suppressor 1 homolog A-like [Limulus polyphemus]
MNTNLMVTRQMSRSKPSKAASEATQHLVEKETDRERHFTKAQNKNIPAPERTTAIGRYNKTSHRTSNIVCDQLWTSIFITGHEREVDEGSRTKHQVSLSRESAAQKNSRLNTSVKSSRDVVPPTVETPLKKTTQIAPPEEHKKSQKKKIQEIDQLGVLSERRSKELKLLKMQLKRACLGFEAFSIVIKYLTDELDNLSKSRTITDTKKTQADVCKAETRFHRYETQFEHLKQYHAEDLQSLTTMLAELHRKETEELTLTYQKKIRTLKANHEEEVRDLKNIHVKSIRDAQIRNKAAVDALREQHNRIIEDLEKDFTTQLQQEVEGHKRSQTSLQDQVKELKKQCKDLQHETKYIEGTLQQDTNSKLQWALAQKVTLQKEVDSLRAVLEIKVEDIHELRTENLEMKKELEKLPVARQHIQKLKARIEDLQAVVDEKVRIERQLASESQHLKEEFEKESKTNSRLSMEKEELQWRLKQTMEANVLHSTKADSSLDVVNKLLEDDLLNELDTSQPGGEDNFCCSGSFSVGSKTLYSTSSTEKNSSSACLPSWSLP